MQLQRLSSTPQTIQQLKTFQNHQDSAECFWLQEQQSLVASSACTRYLQQGTSPKPVTMYDRRCMLHEHFPKRYPILHFVRYIMRCTIKNCKLCCSQRQFGNEGLSERSNAFNIKRLEVSFSSCVGLLIDGKKRVGGRGEGGKEAEGNSIYAAPTSPSTRGKIRQSLGAVGKIHLPLHHCLACRPLHGRPRGLMVQRMPSGRNRCVVGDNCPAAVLAATGALTHHGEQVSASGQTSSQVLKGDRWMSGDVQLSSCFAVA